MKSLQIFRAGKHTASNGKTIEFSEAVLKAAAEGYDPKLHEAPIVVGHPDGAAPAYGWVNKLSFSEGAIEAEPIQVDSAFADLVKAGRFKKISASFFEPDAEDNPRPGVYYLRHVGFLGAQPPAVKGLRNAEFSAAAKGVVEFMDWDAMSVARMFRSLRDWMVGQFGAEAADKALPSWETDNLLVSAVQAQDPAKPISYSEHGPEHTMTPDEIKQQEAALKIREDKLKASEVSFSERDTNLQKQEAASRRTGHMDFAASLVKAGKLLPVQKDGLVAFMCALPEGGTIEFGEGDKKQTPATAQWLRDFLSAQPAHVDFAERGAGDGSLGAAEPDATAIATRAVEFVETERQAGRVVNIAQAVAHVTAAKPA